LDAFLFPRYVLLLEMDEAIIEDSGIPAGLRGYLTQSDGDAVLSTEGLKSGRPGQALEQGM